MMAGRLNALLLFTSSVNCMKRDMDIIMCIKMQELTKSLLAV